MQYSLVYILCSTCYVVLYMCSFLCKEWAPLLDILVQQLQILLLQRSWQVSSLQHSKSAFLNLFLICGTSVKSTVQIHGHITAWWHQLCLDINFEDLFSTVDLEQFALGDTEAQLVEWVQHSNTDLGLISSVNLWRVAPYSTVSVRSPRGIPVFLPLKSMLLFL